MGARETPNSIWDESEVFRVWLGKIESFGIQHSRDSHLILTRRFGSIAGERLVTSWNRLRPSPASDIRRFGLSPVNRLLRVGNRLRLSPPSDFAGELLVTDLLLCWILSGLWAMFPHKCRWQNHPAIGSDINSWGWIQSLFTSHHCICKSKWFLFESSTSLQNCFCCLSLFSTVTETSLTSHRSCFHSPVKSS